MNLAPIPPALPLWLLLTLPLLVTFLLVAWVSKRDRKRAAFRRATGDMLLEQLQQANATVSAYVKAEKDAIHSVAVLPETVGPLEAEAILRAAMPTSSIYDRHALMLHAWEVQKRPQALAALAGMALVDLENPPNIARSTFWRALNEGGPVLLEQIASVLGEHRDQLDNWLSTGGLIVSLELAAGRIETQAPEVAAHLRAMALALEPRCRELMLSNVRFQIETLEDEAAWPEKMAGDLAPYCLPRFPELAAEVHAALGRHEGVEWGRAHIWFDKAVLHRFYDRPGALDHFDFDAALGRLCAGLVSVDAETSRFAAEQAADLLSDYFFDREDYYARLRLSLAEAAVLHPFTPSHEWLAKELDPPEVTSEKLDIVEAAVQQSIFEGVGTLCEVTAAIEPAVALAELRIILPDVPVSTLREALIARWREKPMPVWLAALAGLGLEELGRADPDVRLVHTLFYHPLRDGPAALVRAIASEAEGLIAPGQDRERFARLREAITEALARVGA